MFKRILALTIFSFVFSGHLNALDHIDTFIRDHCGEACNGESPDCRDCYNEAVDLFDQSNPVSPEINFDVDDNHGKLELEF
ncbi:MAG: hypothetical protein JSR85_05900 [Proteobacteria bacterium]|nr:hypothetical protein [Pseudomonadota bacterium]